MEKYKQLFFSEFSLEILEEEFADETEPIEEIVFKATDKKPKYIQKVEDIPIETLKKIVGKGQSILRYDKDKNKYYCNMCKKELSENNYCKSCFKHYDIDKSKIIDMNENKEIIEEGLICNYFQFQIIDNELYLYKFVFNSFYDSFNKQNYRVEIGAVYSINENGIIDLLSNKQYDYDEMNKYLFSDIDVQIEQMENEPEKVNKYYYDMLDNCHLKILFNFLDIDSLDILKNHKLYKYSHIWELKDYLETEKFDLLTLTLFPVYVKEFEYLVKLKLYALAIKKPMMIRFDKTFQKTFGVEKKYYPFMKKINITPNMLKVFQIIQIPDEKILKDMSNYSYELGKLSSKIDYCKTVGYVNKKEISYVEYFNYLEMLESLKIDMKNKKNIFPDDFYDMYYKYQNEMEILSNPELLIDIENSLLLTELNTYEDEEYVIFPASCLDDLCEESKNQRNCVRTYAQQISKNNSQIYFMREKSNLNKSLLTIEVIEGKIVQALGKYNTNPDSELLKILDKWEKTLVPVYNINN